MNFPKNESIFIYPAIPINATGMTAGQVLGFNGTNIVPTNVAGTNDLAGYLPLSAGSNATLTGNLYTGTNEIIVPKIEYKRSDSELNSRVVLENSNLYLDVYDSPSSGAWLTGVHIHNGEGGEGIVVDLTGNEVNVNGSPVASETLIANYGTNYASLSGATFTGSISATNGLIAKTITGSPGTSSISLNNGNVDIIGNALTIYAKGTTNLIRLGATLDTATNAQVTKMTVGWGGINVSCPLSIGTNKITSLALPGASSDLANKDYVDNYAPYVRSNGGTFTGNLYINKTTNPVTINDQVLTIKDSAIMGVAAAKLIVRGDDGNQNVIQTATANLPAYFTGTNDQATRWQLNYSVNCPLNDGFSQFDLTLKLKQGTLESSAVTISSFSYTGAFFGHAIINLSDLYQDTIDIFTSDTLGSTYTHNDLYGSGWDFTAPFTMVVTASLADTTVDVEVQSYITLEKHTCGWGT